MSSTYYGKCEKILFCYKPATFPDFRAKKNPRIAMFFTFFPSVLTYDYTRSVSKNNKKYSQNVLTGFTIRDTLTSCSRDVNTAEPEPLKKITHWGYNRRHRNTLNRKNELKTSQQDLSFGRALTHF